MDFSTIEQALSSPRGVIVAPAGCGKTQTIIDYLKNHTGKPVLILTHTNAGVAALKERLKRAKIPNKNCKIYTIDGWALRIVRAFPIRADFQFSETRRMPYNDIAQGLLKILQDRSIHKEIAATYSKILIDEYQDCSALQHEIVLSLPSEIPVCILGDQLQGIFDFGGRTIVSWRGIQEQFPIVARLNTPWRWKKKNQEDFGLWLLSLRDSLIKKTPVDLRLAPPNVVWHPISNRTSVSQAQQRLISDARQANETVLILGSATSPVSRAEYARGMAGTCVLEPVDMAGLTDHGSKMQDQTGTSLVKAILEFSSDVMTKVSDNIPTARITILANKTNRTQPSTLESILLELLNSNNPKDAVRLIKALRATKGTRLFRVELYDAMIEALNKATNFSDFENIAIGVRERRRMLERKIYPCTVGSTLLLKGLEADHAIILDADEMSRRHFYVAATRASISLHVYSKTPIYTPV